LPPETARPRLTVVGSINLDFVARCERLPRPGETVTDATFERGPGGKGANQAVAAARMGAQVRMIGCVGRDEFAEQALVYLRDEVELEISVREEPTGVAVIFVDSGGENVIVVAPGANRAVTGDAVPETDDALLCQLEVPMGAVTAVAQRARGFFAVNVAPARPVAPEVLERADLVVANRYEFEALDGAPRGLVALTLGADGAVLLDGGEEVASARPPAVDAVDGTAAGDAFTASLVVSLLEGRARDEALARACAAGALAASRPGAQPSLPTAGEVDAVVAR
jgi:ribokinase